MIEKIVKIKKDQYKPCVLGIVSLHRSSLLLAVRANALDFLIPTLFIDNSTQTGVMFLAHV